MKYSALLMGIFGILLLLPVTYPRQAQENPLLVVILMVKNEAPVMEATLKPFIAAGIQHYLILDTGSTDRTVACTQDIFKRYNVQHGLIREAPFVDFATSRNEAIDQAEKAFPTATFMLMVDAEWYLNNAPALLEFCASKQEETHRSYLIRVLQAGLDYYNGRLIRCRTGVRYVGAVHEVLNHSLMSTESEHQKIPEHIYFDFSSTETGEQKSQRRWIRDLEILHREYGKDPSNARTVFYLAQTYTCLQRWPEGLRWYLHRANMGGWEEEAFVARYRAAQIYEILGNKEQAIAEFITAINERPHRAEPYVRLAMLYARSGNFKAAYPYAEQGALLPYPKEELLFVEQELYDFERYDVLGVIASDVREYEKGLWAVRKALAHKRTPELEKNLAWYLYHTPQKSCKSS